jgi:hypothetical protein
MASTNSLQASAMNWGLAQRNNAANVRIETPEVRKRPSCTVYGHYHSTQAAVPPAMHLCTLRVIRLCCWRGV